MPCQHVSTVSPTAVDSSNVLLLAPSLSDGDDEVCRELLTISNPGDQNLLSVRLTGSADAPMQSVPGRPAGRPERVGIISVGDTARSAGQEATPNARPTGPLSTETIADPRDLTRLGNTITNYIAAWEENPAPTALCFDSLTSLLHHAEFDRVFRFIHLLVGRIRQYDAFAHFHLDPGAHDDRTVDRMLHLFDGAIDVDGEQVRITERR